MLLPHYRGWNSLTKWCQQDYSWIMGLHHHVSPRVCVIKGLYDHKSSRVCAITSLHRHGSSRVATGLPYITGLPHNRSASSRVCPTKGLQHQGSAPSWVCTIPGVHHHGAVWSAELDKDYKKVWSSCLWENSWSLRFSLPFTSSRSVYVLDTEIYSDTCCL